MPKLTEFHRVLRSMHMLSVSLLKDRNFASRSDDVLLLVGVAIGTLEGKPMTANKLGPFVGMPRTTAIRRLRVLARAGLVERDGKGRYALSPEGRKRAASLA